MKPVLVFQHVPHETLGTLEPLFHDVGLPCRHIQFFRDTPEYVEVGEAAGLVVLGGPMNVDEIARYPFLQRETSWIREALWREIPVLGICLGSQLLAKALDANVHPNRMKEIGWYRIELTAEATGDWLFGRCQPQQTVFQWHGDTFDLPEGAELLATSEACAHQAFRHGEHVYALQFHVEVTGEIIESWLGEPGNQREMAELPRVDPEEIRRRMGQELTTMLELGRAMMDRFANLCRNESP